jgi:hypothetical protein
MHQRGAFHDRTLAGTCSSHPLPISPLDGFGLVGYILKGVVLLAMHVDDVAGNPHVGDVIRIVDHHMQQVKPERER